MRTDEFSRASVDHPERNEDAYLLFTGNGQFAPVFAVIDGMGGHQHTNAAGQLITGHEASQTVRQVLQEELLELPLDVSAEAGGFAEEKLFTAIERANEVLFEQLNEGQHSQGRRVGAVMTIAILCENGKRLLVAQVGDTRAYLFNTSNLIQLCDDEDNVSYLVQNAIMSEEDGQRISEILNTFDGINEPETPGTVNIFGQDYELQMAWRWFLMGNPALQIPGANAVLSALGIDEDCPYPQLARIEIGKGDVLLMASDGIYKNLAQAEIISQLQEAHQAAQALGEAAYLRSQDGFNRRSTSDDITAIYVKFE
jgi:serine/threonine protein phosphatase PrpC